jgi:hypothetical protein
MIGHFRHEAMNQATVIAGFCVLINYELEKAPCSANARFAQAMKAITQLLDVFTSSLNSFRKECSINGLSQQQLEDLDPSTKLNPYFSQGCGEQFSSLAAMAENISATAGSISKADIHDDKLYQRFQYIQESAAKLNELFTNPVFHMQRMMKVHTRNL